MGGYYVKILHKTYRSSIKLRTLVELTYKINVSFKPIVFEELKWVHTKIIISPDNIPRDQMLLECVRAYKIITIYKI